MDMSKGWQLAIDSMSRDIAGVFSPPGAVPRKYRELVKAPRGERRSPSAGETQVAPEGSKFVSATTYRAPPQHTEERMINAHMDEIARHGAKLHQGRWIIENSVLSNTSHGRLKTSHVGGGNYKHEWGT